MKTPAKSSVKKTSAKKAAPKKLKVAKKKVFAAKPAAPFYHVGPLIDCQAHLDAAVCGLQALDPVVINAMLGVSGPVPLRRSEPGFDGLAGIIISQQVSVASANAIFGRLKAAFSPLSAEAVLACDEAVLKSCGLSAPKIRGLKALAAAIVEGGLDLTGMGEQSAESAHQALVAVKGIGPWTADIFLMFCLGHPDAWPAGDLALQEAAKIALGLAARPDTRGLEAIGERWRPHRAVAARFLWAYYRVAKSGRDGIAAGV